MKPNFLSIAVQTWDQLRRFPTSDAPADAVMLQAVWELIRTPFGIAKFFALTQEEFFSKWRRWNFLILPLHLFLNVFRVFWHFNLPLRLRRDEKKAWRVVTNLTLLSVLSYANALFMFVYLRNAPRDLTDKDKARMTEEQVAQYELQVEKWREKPRKPIYTPRQIVSLISGFGLALNILVRALQKPTRARFDSKMP